MVIAALIFLYLSTNVPQCLPSLPAFAVDLSDATRAGGALLARRCRDAGAAPPRLCTLELDGVGTRPPRAAAAAPGHSLRCAAAHYRPSRLCLAEHAVLHESGMFQLDAPPTLEKGDFGEIFAFGNASAADRTCAHVVEGRAVAFTLPYHFGRLNYYHLHYDVLLPLHALLVGPLAVRSGAEGREIDALVEAWRDGADADADDADAAPVTLVPAVEHGVFHPTLPKGVDWGTNLFDRGGGGPALWREALERLYGACSGVGGSMAPLNDATRRARAPLCFRSLLLGLPKVKHGDAALLRSYVAHTLASFGVEPGVVASGAPSASASADARGDGDGDGDGSGSSSSGGRAPPLVVGFVVRRGRRKVLNVAELLTACVALGVERGEEWACERVDFDGMTLGEQVARVQRFSVLVGMQGAGMINGMWLPRGAAALVLFQLNPSGDHFRKLLRPLLGTRRYFTWVNTNASASLIADPERDPYGDQADTRVDVKEFSAQLSAAAASVGRRA